MTDFSLAETIGDNLEVIIPVLLALIGLIVFYYILLIKAIRQMLLQRVPSVLLTFAFISLVPIPFALLLGITILIIWHYHKREYQTGSP